MSTYNVDLQTNYPSVAYNCPGGSGKTIYSSGCCPASVRNILVNLCGIKTTIRDMCSLAISCGARVNGGTLPETLLKAAQAKYGGFTYQYTTSDSAARAHAAAGGMALCHTTGSNKLFSTSGHFVAMAAAASSRVTIIDPYIPANKWTIYNRQSYITTTSTKGVVTTTTTKSDESFDYYYLISKAPTDAVTVTACSKSVNITATKLNVRSGPGTSYSVLGTLAKGAIAAVTGVAGEWYRINYGSDYGYISSAYTADVSITTNNTSNQEDEDNMTYYKMLTDVPSYYQEAIKKLVDSGAMAGTGNEELNVSEDLCRMATVLNNAGILDLTAPIVYKTIDDVPSYYRNAVQKMIDRGAISGTGNDELNLSSDICRALTILDNAHLLDAVTLADVEADEVKEE